MIDQIYIEEIGNRPTLIRWLFEYLANHRENRHELIAEQLKPRNVPMVCL